MPEKCSACFSAANLLYNYDILNSAKCTFLHKSEICSYCVQTLFILSDNDSIS